MQPDLPVPDLPVPGERPGRSPFDDLRERLARLPGSHPSAPGYRDVPGGHTEADAAAAGDPPAGFTEAGAAAGGDCPAGPAGAGEPDGAGADGDEDGPDPGGPDAVRGVATQRPGRGEWPGGTAVGYLPTDGGDGPYRPWFSGEPPQPWFSDDPAGRSG